MPLFGSRAGREGGFSGVTRDSVGIAGGTGAGCSKPSALCGEEWVTTPIGHVSSKAEQGLNAG